MDVDNDRTTNEIYMLKSLRRAKLALRKAFRYATKLRPIQQIDPSYSKGKMIMFVDQTSLKFYELQVLLDEMEDALNVRLDGIPTSKDLVDLQKAKAIAEYSDDFNFFKDYFSSRTNKKQLSDLIEKDEEDTEDYNE